MTSFATDRTGLEAGLDLGLRPGFEYDDGLAGSVLDPRRTTRAGEGEADPAT